MQQHNPNAGRNQKILHLHSAAVKAPANEAYESDPQFRSAFDEELRALAEEIVENHPSLTQLLLSLGAGKGHKSPVCGRN